MVRETKVLTSAINLLLAAKLGSYGLLNWMVMAPMTCLQAIASHQHS
ncbi:hypothetical protein [Allocoleopsis sp.]